MGMEKKNTSTSGKRRSSLTLGVVLFLGGWEQLSMLCTFKLKPVNNKGKLLPLTVAS